MMHPWHVNISQSKASDWTLKAPLLAALPCGLMLSCSAKHDGFSISGFEDGRVQHILTLHPTVIPKTFEQALNLLKSHIPYDEARDVHRRLMRWLIGQDFYGRWRFWMLKSAILIESIEDQQEVFDQDRLPLELQHGLLALYDQNLPSFGDTAFAPHGQIECHLPASSHARLQIFQQYFEAS